MGGGKSYAAPYQSNSEKVSVQQQSDEHTQCTGIVTDAQGEPIVGASIRIKGTSIGAVTDVNGKFVIKKGVTNQASLVVTYLGYEDQTVKWNGKPMNIVLAEKSKALEGVVVTGIFERKKEGFTGSANRVSGDDIRKISSGNILNAITMLDPGFRKGDNMLSGSNPSSVPEFSMRGQSSMGDYSTDETVIMRGDVDTRPNQPLFVLDGIIGVSVTKIMDIDPAQIESITLLKDAAAMAIYGSQASNGVIVVETKAPAAGKLRVTYNGNYKIEYPDLTDYNLLNAAEKLELEKRAGFYSDPTSVQDEQNKLEIYRRKLLDVERGVNTYWLSQPLRTVFAQRHGLNIEGGTNELRYKLYAGVNSAPGIMKGTGVNGTSVSLDIRYRYKGLLISNVAYVDYTTSDRTSPYGTFNDYALLNPYYRIYDSNGQIAKYLERSVTTTDGHYRTSGADVGNPMYNTLYNTKDQNKAFEVRKTCVWRSTSPSPRPLRTTTCSNRQTIPTTSPFRTSTRGVCTTGPTTHAWDGTQPSPPIIIRYGRVVTYSLRSSAGTSSRTSITAPACILRASPTTIWTRCTSEPRFNLPVATKVRHALSAVWQQ